MKRVIPRLLTALALCTTPLGCISEGEGPAEQPDCPDCPPPDASVDGMTPLQPAEPACLDEKAPLDLLLVIDNSGSMCEEQDKLGRAFESFSLALGDRDWRMAVVTTDMNPENGRRGAFGNPPALPVPSLNCLDAMGEPDVPDTEDCRDVDARPVLDGAQFEPEDAARRFRCMVTVGTQGDGFEKPLSAAALALDCAGPNAGLLGPCGADDPQFLRPGAALAVIYVSDEDDCSDPDSVVDPAADPAADRPCDRDPELPCAIERTQNANCSWYADELEPVQTFVERLRAANPEAPGVTALTLSGPRFAPVGGHPVRFVPGRANGMCADDDNLPVISEQCCPEGACPGEPRTVCESELGSAFAGNRLRALSEAFPGGCADCGSICEIADFDGLSAQLAAKLDAALPPLCE